MNENEALERAEELLERLERDAVDFLLLCERVMGKELEESVWGSLRAVQERSETSR